VDPLHPDGYKMGTLCRLSGLRPELIRAWQRPHGLFDPQRTVGQHRMFTRDDLDVALWLRGQVAEGRTVSELAALGRREILRRIHPPEAPTLSQEAPGLGVDAMVPEDEDLAACRSGLVRAAEQVDGGAASQWIRRARTSFATDVLVSGILRPALVEIGLGWADGTVSVAGEHAVAGAIRTFLLLLREEARDGSGPPIVLACGPRELHEIPALLHGWELHRRGESTRWFGADLPISELDRACAAAGATEVHISCSRRETYLDARPALASWALGHAGAVTVHVGGAGVPMVDAEMSHAGVILGR
jgi:hypothetical protein